MRQYILSLITSRKISLVTRRFKSYLAHMKNNFECIRCESKIIDRRKNKTFCGEECRSLYISSLVEKKCTKCFEIKSISEFSKAPETYDRLSSRCKACVREAWETWYYKDDSARLENARLNRKRYAEIDVSDKLHKKKLSKYGLTQIEYEKLVLRSGGLCEICKKRPFEVIDHCHTSGKVRGLLCSMCNRSLGGFKDDVDVLKNAIKYVTVNK